MKLISPFAHSIRDAVSLDHARRVLETLDSGDEMARIISELNVQEFSQAYNNIAFFLLGDGRDGRDPESRTREERQSIARAYRRRASKTEESSGPLSKAQRIEERFGLVAEKCTCGADLDETWFYCPNCGRRRP